MSVASFQLLSLERLYLFSYEEYIGFMAQNQASVVAFMPTKNFNNFAFVSLDQFA